MFGHKHYVPVLRWKQGEWTALGLLDPDDKKSMTPIIELTPRSFNEQSSGKKPSVDDVLFRALKEMHKNWGFDSLFVDLCLLDSSLRSASGHHPMAYLFKEARPLKLKLVPVTGLVRDSKYQASVLAIIKKDKRGLCLRVFKEDLLHKKFLERTKQTFAFFNIQPEDIDLVLDFQWNEESPISMKNACKDIPHITRWRTFTVLSGVFPKDLSEFKPGVRRLQRRDWLNWRNLHSSNLPRKPSFGDYTTQHPIFREPPKGANPSASIRYTSESEWVIMRGERLRGKKTPGEKQWPANAKLLKKMPEFCGANFSAGDSYIVQKSLEPKPTGNAMTWLRAGINHHITYVVRQIANLAG